MSATPRSAWLWWTARRGSPPQSETGTMLVNGERVEVSRYLTVSEIRAGLPAHLVDEFNEMVETTPAEFLRFHLLEWGLPPEKLLPYRKAHAERLYRSVCLDWENATIPADLDVDTVIRNHGYLSEQDMVAGKLYGDDGETR